MKYYVIEPEVNNKYIYIKPENIDLPTSFLNDFANGMRLEDRFTVNLLNKDKNRIKTDYIAGPITTPIISSRFKELLLGFNIDNVEFNSVEIRNSYDDDVDDSYFHLNLLNNLDAIDRKKSEYKVVYMSDDDIIEVSSSEINNYPDSWSLEESKSLILDKKVVGLRSIFRVENIRAIIIINEILKNKIEEAGLIGINIQPLETYPYGHY